MDWIETFDRQMRRELQALYASEWWTKERTPKEVERVLDNSQLTIGLLDKRGHLIAFARVLTDFRFKAIIFDVIVREDRRGEGLGDAIMKRIEDHPALKEVESLELYCQQRTVGFYQRLGYAHGTATRLYKSRNTTASVIDQGLA